MYSYTKTTSISWPFYVIIYLRRKMVIMNNHHYFLNNLKEIKCNIKEKNFIPGLAVRRIG